MGYYLDIHRGTDSEGQLDRDQLRELLLKEGAREEFDAIWFAGGRGTLHPGADLEIASFRYPFGLDPNVMRECAMELLQFCNRRKLRLYDGQIRKYINEENIDAVVDPPISGRELARQTFPLERFLVVAEDNRTCDLRPLSERSDIPAEILDARLNGEYLSVRSRRALDRLNVRTLRDWPIQAPKTSFLRRTWGLPLYTS